MLKNVFLILERYKFLIFKYQQLKLKRSSGLLDIYISFDALSKLIPLKKKKNMENTLGGVMLLVKVQAEAFFYVFKLCKWYQIAQGIIYMLLRIYRKTRIRVKAKIELWRQQQVMLKPLVAVIPRELIANEQVKMYGWSRWVSFVKVSWRIKEIV